MTTPHLDNREAFEAILNDYHVGEAGKAVLAKAQLVLLIAPTAVGRNTIINELVKTGKYQFIITDTTRPPRVNNGVLERDGVEYYFRKEEDMLDDIKHGRFVEAAIIHNQQVSGMSIREIEKAHSLGKVSITDIEIVGTENVMHAKPTTISIFIVPPSFDEWLRRLRTRNPNMASDELRRRLASAVQELKTARSRSYYHFVVNDTLEEAVKDVDKIARLGMIDTAEQDKAKMLVKSLLTQTESFLKTEANSDD